jgi:hypothetical protein
MRTTKIIFISIIAIIIGACSSSKKSTRSTVSTTSATTDFSANPYWLVKPANGIYAPGNEELTAIQTQYKDVTLEQLKEGYAIYATGACIKCHAAMNIYERGEVQWKGIVENMARKAQLSEPQKDAVYRYVLSVKAANTKQTK